MEKSLARELAEDLLSEDDDDEPKQPRLCRTREGVDLTTRLPWEVVVKHVAVYLRGEEDGAALRAAAPCLLELGEADALWPPPRDEKNETEEEDGVFYRRRRLSYVEAEAEDVDDLVGGAYWSRRAVATQRQRERSFECLGSCWAFVEQFLRRDLFEQCTAEHKREDDDMRRAEAVTSFEATKPDARRKFARVLPMCVTASGPHHTLDCIDAVAADVADRLCRDTSSTLPRRFAVFDAWACGLERAMDDRYPRARALAEFRRVAVYGVRGHHRRPRTDLLVAFKGYGLDPILYDPLFNDPDDRSAAFNWSVTNLAATPALPAFSVDDVPLFATLLALDVGSVSFEATSFDDPPSSASLRPPQEIRYRRAADRDFRNSFLLPLRAVATKYAAQQSAAA